MFAQAQGRTGYARGTLAPRMGRTAEVPPMDARPLRTMTDMGMSMAGMKGMNMSGMKGMDMAGMKGMDMSASGDSHPAQQDMAGMKMDGMDMSGMKMDDMLMGSATGTIPFPQPGARTMPLPKPAPKEGNCTPPSPVHMHIGPQVDEVSMNVAERLHDPGDGLNDNRRRGLTYADLRSRYRGVDGRPPSRELALHRTGNLERYLWGLNGKKFSQAEAIKLKLGSQV